MKLSNQRFVQTLSLAAIMMLGWQSSAFADTSIEKQVANMKQQIQRLEQQIQNNKKQDSDNGWFKSISVGGLVEVEAAYAKDYDDVDASDINVATVELGIEAVVNEWASASVVLLWEEEDGGDDNLKIDEALITLTPESTGPVSFNFGRTAIPFGVFDTHMVSDSLTLELGETKETIAMVGFESNGMYGNAYVFNGDLDKDGSDNAINNVGMNIGYAWEQGDQAFDVSLGYINDIGDSDGLSDTVSTNSPSSYARNIPGLAMAAKYTAGPFSVIGEYVGATKDFGASELAFNGAGARPSTWNLEAGYTFDDTTVALGYQKTKEALGLEFPETRLSASISFPVMESTTLSLEWAHDSDYDAADGGTGENANTVTAQLAVEF